MEHPREELAHSIAAHIVERVRLSTPQLDAFPHFAIDNFFPDCIFQRLIGDLPPFDELILMSQAGMSSVARYDRRAMLPVKELQGRCDPEVWEQVSAALGSDSIERALIEAFTPWLSKEMREKLRRPLRREVRVHCDKAGSFLFPHTDAPSMFIVSFCYMTSPSPNDPTLDTVLYEPRDPLKRLEAIENQDYAHEPREHHRRVGQVKFKPNRLFTFLRTNTSLHGLEPVAPSAAPRYLVSLHLKYAK